jgi:hypothetical protein
MILLLLTGNGQLYIVPGVANLVLAGRLLRSSADQIVALNVNAVGRRVSVLLLLTPGLGIDDIIILRCCGSASGAFSNKD